VTPFPEEQPQLPIDNFYYVQEDEVFAAAARRAFSWSVHRPHSIIGHALDNAMNIGVTLAVYAAICRETGHPSRFPGSEVQWNGLTDVNEARLLARLLEWAATSEAGRNQAFNVVNGDIFCWNWLWPKLAGYFGVEAAGFSEAAAALERQMQDAVPIWTRIAGKHRLIESNLGRLASWWHTDADLGRPFETVTDVSLEWFLDRRNRKGIPENQRKSDSASRPGWRPAGMAKPYSDDLRERVVRAVEGGSSRHERLGDSASA
jgi:nucleoside-diphosphate-sugar epimerase